VETVLGLDSEGVVWRVLKQLPGRRAAGARWGDRVRNIFEVVGVRRFLAQPHFCAKEGTRIVIESHMDDFHGVGRRFEVEASLNTMREKFRLEASDVILEGEYSHLKRIRWQMEDATIFAPTPKHERKMILALGLEGAKGVNTPRLAEDRPVDSSPIDDARAKACRSCIIDFVV